MTPTEHDLAVAVVMLWEAEAGGECEHGVGHERDCPAGDACPLNPLRPTIREAYTITAMNRVRVEEGMRVRLDRDVERFPHFTAPAGMTGTVTDITDNNISVRMDEHLPGAETWDNEIVWHDVDDASASSFYEDTTPIIADDLRVIRTPDGDDYVAYIIKVGGAGRGAEALVKPAREFLGGAAGDPEPEQLRERWVPLSAVTNEEVPQG